MENIRSHGEPGEEQAEVWLLVAGRWPGGRGSWLWASQQIIWRSPEVVLQSLSLCLLSNPDPGTADRTTGEQVHLTPGAAISKSQPGPHARTSQPVPQQSTSKGDDGRNMVMYKPQFVCSLFKNCFKITFLR